VCYFEKRNNLPCKRRRRPKGEGGSVEGDEEKAPKAPRTHRTVATQFEEEVPEFEQVFLDICEKMPKMKKYAILKNPKKRLKRAVNDLIFMVNKLKEKKQEVIDIERKKAPKKIDNPNVSWWLESSDPVVKVEDQ